MAKVTVSFTLDGENDRDLVRWLNGLPKGGKSERIRAVLRSGLARGGITIGDVYQAVKALESKVQAGIVIHNGQVNEEPPDAAEALDKLAEMGE